MLSTLSGRPASQNERELLALEAFMSERGVASYLEVGARHGDTFHHVVSSLGAGARGVAVDMAGALWGAAASADALGWAARDLGRLGYGDVHVIFGDSHDGGVVSAVRGLGPYGLALIDADHTYAAVAQDFRDYSPMAEYVAFHDIAGHTQGTRSGGRRHRVEVPRLWRELRAGREHWEFVDAGSQMGIGVLRVKQQETDK